MIRSSGVDEIIIDFEDALLKQQRAEGLKQLKDGGDLYKSSYLRIPLHNAGNRLDFSLLDQFLHLGFTKFVLPKLASSSETDITLNHMLSISSKAQLILLIEHPKLLVQLRDVMQLNHADSIVGLGIGSHDLLGAIGAEHTAEQTFFPRMEALYVAKAYDKLSIDIASMNIGNKSAFDEEVESGALSGYDAKFLIHPLQHTWLVENDTVKNKAVQWAQMIMESLPDHFDGENLEPYVYNGMVIEKPHFEKAKLILKKYT